jgi:EamA domain-containing membrane protein RarD
MGDEAYLGDALDILAVAIAAALIPLTLGGKTSAARLLLTLAFACYVPGRAIVSNWRVMSTWSEAAIPMLFSIAFLALTATVTISAHYWHPVGLFQVEAVLSLVALTFGIRRRHLHRTRRPQHRQSRIDGRHPGP